MEYKIDISQVEEWQMLKNTTELDALFIKAKSTIVQGGKLLLYRKNPDQHIYITEEISSEDDLKLYKERVYKYLN